MYCTNCGAELNDNARFCPKCGAPVDKESVDVQQTETEYMNPDDAGMTNGYVRQAGQGYESTAEPANPSVRQGILENDNINESENEDKKSMGSYAGDITEKIKQIPKKTLAAVGGVAAALVVIIVIALVVVSGNKTVDLNDYITISVSGYDTVGKASYIFDEDAFTEDLNGKIKYSSSFQKKIDAVTDYDRAYYLYYGSETISLSDVDAVTDRMALVASFENCDPSAVMSELDNVTFSYIGTILKSRINDRIRELSKYDVTTMFSSFVKGYLSPTIRLSNGDTVYFFWNLSDYDKAIAEECFNYDIDFSYIEYVVEDLPPITEYDAFADIEVSFSGIGPDGKATVENNSHDAAAKGLSVSVEPSSGLSNGMTVTVSIDQSKASSSIEQYGRAPESYEKEYVVEGLSSYVTELSQIPDETMEEMKKQSEDGLYDYVDRRWVSYVSVDRMDFLGNYLLTAKDPSSQKEKNRCYCIYKYQVTNAKDEENPEHYEFYFYAYFTNLLSQPDGTCSVDLDNCTICTDWTRVGSLGYNGFETLDKTFDECVTKYTDNYAYESNF